MTASIERENTFARSIIENCVRAVADILYLADRLQRLQIENRDRSFPAIADKSTPELGCERDAVNARSVGNIAHLLAGVGVNHYHVSGAGNKKMVSIGINFQIIPSSVAAQLEGLNYVQAGIGGEH